MLAKIKHVRRRRGSAVLEGSLVILLLCNVLIGIFDLGQVLFIRQTFVYRARSAVRYGAITNASDTVIKNMALYASTVAPEGATSGTFGLTAAMVSIARVDAGTPEQRLIVTISGYPYRFFTPWIAGTFSGRDIVAAAPLELP